MIYQQFLNNLGIIILSISPISLILIRIFNKIFYNYNAKLSNTTVICTKINNILTKNQEELKTIIFDKFIINTQNKKMVEIENQENHEIITLDQKHLEKEESIQKIIAINHLCHYNKTSKIERIINKFFLTKFQKRNYEVLENFSSNKEKKISTIIIRKKENKEIFSYCKGNALELLKKCTKIQINQKKIELTTQKKRKLRKKIEKLNKNGQKTIAFAYKGLPVKKLNKYKEEYVENELTLLGIIGLEKPIIKENKEYIKKIKNLGIKIYVLSHEKERNTIAISKKLNIINPHYHETITGSFLENINDNKLKKLLSNKEKDYIFSELETKHIERITNTLKEQGEKVINTSNYKFNEIYEGLKNGNIINKNKNKIINHAIKAKIIQVLIIIITLLLNIPIPFSIGTLLLIEFINFIIEIKFIRNKEEEDFLKNKYSPKKTSIIKSIKKYLISNIIFTVLILSFFIGYLLSYGWTYNNIINNPFAIQKGTTMIFILFAGIQIFSIYKISDKIIRKILLLIVVITITNNEIILNSLKFEKLDIIEWQILSLLILGPVILKTIYEQTRIKNHN